MEIFGLVTGLTIILVLLGLCIYAEKRNRTGEKERKRIATKWEEDYLKGLHEEMEAKKRELEKEAEEMRL